MSNGCKNAGNLFKDIPDNLKGEFFETLAFGKEIKIERIISLGQTSPKKGWYDQPQNEWVVVLSGGAIIAFENRIEAKLTKGDHLLIPAHTKHKVTWTDPDRETIWLAVHYN